MQKEREKEREINLRGAVAFGIIMIIAGVLLVGFGSFIFLHEDKYFTAEGVVLHPGEVRNIFVAPGTRIVVESYTVPFCKGSKLTIYNQYGMPVWVSKSIATTGAHEEVPNECSSGTCIYKIELYVPPDCNYPDKTATYTIYVLERNWKGFYTILLGLLLLICGIILIIRRLRKTNVHP